MIRWNTNRNSARAAHPHRGSASVCLIVDTMWHAVQTVLAPILAATGA